MWWLLPQLQWCSSADANCGTRLLMKCQDESNRFVQPPAHARKCTCGAQQVFQPCSRGLMPSLASSQYDPLPTARHAVGCARARAWAALQAPPAKKHTCRLRCKAPTAEQTPFKHCSRRLCCVLSTGAHQVLTTRPHVSHQDSQWQSDSCWVYVLDAIQRAAAAKLTALICTAPPKQLLRSTQPGCALRLPNSSTLTAMAGLQPPHMPAGQSAGRSHCVLLLL